MRGSQQDGHKRLSLPCPLLPPARWVCRIRASPAVYHELPGGHTDGFNLTNKHHTLASICDIMFAELWKVADKSRKAMRPIDAMKAGVAAAKHADGKKVRNPMIIIRNRSSLPLKTKSFTDIAAFFLSGNTRSCALLRRAI